MEKLLIIRCRSMPKRSDERTRWAADQSTNTDRTYDETHRSYSAFYGAAIFGTVGRIA